MNLAEYAIVVACSGVGCTGSLVPKEADAVRAHLVLWSVTDNATGMTLSSGCALNYRNVPDSGQYARVIHVTESPGATVTEEVRWEAVIKTEYQPVIWPTDDAYWCGNAGLRSERQPDYHGRNEKCIVAADPDPPAVIQELTLLPTNDTADPTGRQLKLAIRRTGILRLTFDPMCLNLPPAAGPFDVWDELTIDP